MNMRANSPFPRSLRGFSLIELMIAMTLGLLLVGSIGYVYLGSRQTFRTVDDFSRIQENVRYALDQIGVDVRQAGYSGCVNVSSSVAPLVPAGNFLAQAIQGYRNGAGRPASMPAPGAAAGYVAGTDVLRINRARELGVNVTGLTAGATIPVSGNPASGDPDPFLFVAGRTLLISDCTSAEAFTANAVPAGAGNITAAAAITKAYSNVAEVFPILDTVYYIGTNPANRPALYRIQNGGAPQELIENVENLVLRFGVDVTAPSDFVIDQYDAADAVTAGAVGVALVNNWRRVRSVRVNLVFVSNSNNVATGAQPCTVEGNNCNPLADMRLRQVATATYGLRNRLP